MSVPCGILVVNDPDVDDYTAVLYNQFATTYTNIWCRSTHHPELSNHPVTQRAYLVLGFTEWANDKAYYGDWWRTGGAAFLTGDNSNRASTQRWNLSGTTGITFLTPGLPGVGSVHDLHAQFLGIFSGKARWLFEIYVDGVLSVSDTFDSAHDPGKVNFTSINSLVFFNQYGNSIGGVNPWVYVDDVSVGTSMGASDILPVQTFDDGSFGAFTLYAGDAYFPPPAPYTSVDSFTVTSACGGGPLWFHREGVWRNAGSDPEHNVYMYREGAWRQVAADSSHDVHCRYGGIWVPG